MHFYQKTFFFGLVICFLFTFWFTNTAFAMEYPFREDLLAKLRADEFDGISKGLLEQHYGLYKGYVTNLNACRKDMMEHPTPDRRRRYGFEYNGVVLHELYFENMLPKGSKDSMSPELLALIAKQFGSFDSWLADFKATGATRSIGWAILYFDPTTGLLNNHFIELHECNTTRICTMPPPN